MPRAAIIAIVMLVAASAGALADSQADSQAISAARANTGFVGKDVQTLEIDDCPAVPPVSQDRLRQIGSEHFERGEVLYVQGDYPGAVNELVASYCLIPFYSILKDIGQAYERELDYEKAIAYLERYVMAVPKDAQRASQCAPDPQDDKKNVLARIKVLRGLPARILVDTAPPNAAITLSNENGVQSRGVSGQELLVSGGTYTMTISHAGYHTSTRELHAEIGKPYTYFDNLKPVLGHLTVRVTPADARLFLNDNSIGYGEYLGDLPGDHYKLVAELPGRMTITRVVEVVPDKSTEMSFELPPEPQVGRRQLLGYASLAGAAAGGLIAGATENASYTLGGIGGGLVAGFFGTYWGTPRDIALGTSSLSITSSLIGGVAGLSSAFIANSNATVGAPMVGAGLVIGGVIGYYAGDRVHVLAGDAAMVNSGALWGTTAGALFAESFGADRRISGGLVLSGLGMGTAAGVLVTRYFSVSRGRAALIDVGGVVGLFIGVAGESLYSQASNGVAGNNERTANFTLGGMAAGLAIAGILTRNMDELKFQVSPTVGKVATSGGGSTSTFGIGGSW